MSGTELSVVITAAFLGYWIVSLIMTGKPKNKPAAENTPDFEPAKENTPSWPRVLNVAHDASKEEIENAYQALIAQYQPDQIATLSEDAKALAAYKAREINKAYAEALRHLGLGT